MSLPLPPQGYSVLDQAQTRSQIVQQMTQQQASLQQLQTAVATYPAWDLRHYAARAGVTLGQGNDQPAFDAAHAAMAALAPKAMLYVWVPPGLYMIDQLLIHTCAGFYCDPGTAMLRQTPQTTPRPMVCFAALDDTADQGSTAAAWLLYGFKIDGGWALDWTAAGGVDESDPALFHYAASEYSGGDPDRTATIGQAGVFLRGAFADAAFPTISDNAPFSHGDGDARFLVGELDICNVGGDGFFLQGTGAGVIGPIRVYQAGGRGIVLNAYDCHVTVLDAGVTGLEGMVLRSQCSDVRISAAKAWFTGLRANAAGADAGHQTGCWIDQCYQLTATIEVQDSVGSAFRIGGVAAPQLTLRANWIGLPPAQQTADCGGIDLVAARYAVNASQAGRIELSIDPGVIAGSGPYPHVAYAVNAAAPLMGTRLLLDQFGLPGDDTTDTIQPGWLAGAAAHYDRCRVSFGTLERAIDQWAANSAGYINFGLNVSGATAGANANTSGQANLIAVGRSAAVQLACYDPATGGFSYPVRGGLDSAGAPVLGFFNVGVMAGQPTARGDTHLGAGGSGAAALVDTRFTGGLGSTGYTTGDVVLALKQLGLLAL